METLITEIISRLSAGKLMEIRENQIGCKYQECNCNKKEKEKPRGDTKRKKITGEYTYMD